MGNTKSVDDWDDTTSTETEAASAGGSSTDSVDAFGMDPQEADPDTGLWDEPPTSLRLPLGFVASNGDYIRDVELRPMDGKAEKTLQEEGGNRIERAERGMAFLSMCIQAIGKKRRTKDVAGFDNEPADWFVSDLRKLPIQCEVAMILGVRQVSVHIPGSGISGRKFVFDQYCPKPRCVNAEKGLKFGVRLDRLKKEELPDAFCQEETHSFEAAGRRIQWRTLTLNDKAKIMRAKEELPDFQTALLWLSTVSLDGKTKPSLAEIEGLPKSVRNVFRSKVDRGGYVVKVNNRCPECRTEWDVMLPWEQKGFFFPSEGESDETKTPSTPSRY